MADYDIFHFYSILDHDHRLDEGSIHLANEKYTICRREHFVLLGYLKHLEWLPGKYTFWLY